MDGDEEEGMGCTHYEAVTCTGLQPNSDVFIFGPEFQVWYDGTLIPTNQQTFVWIDSILRKLPRPVNPLPPVPTYGLNHLGTLLRGMRDIAGDNVLSGVYLFGRCY